MMAVFVKLLTSENPTENKLSRQMPTYLEEISTRANHKQ